MILLGDFNVEVNDNHMKSFCENYGLKNLIKQPTCYKNPSNPTCIYLILTNVHRSFQSTCVIETGLSDLNMMALTVMRKGFKKFQPRIINYRPYKHFSMGAYRESLINKLSQENFVYNEGDFQSFCDISLTTLNKHTACKKNMFEVIKCLSFDKELSKAIMTRTKLGNNFSQNKSEENRKIYVKQRNFCVFLLRKIKKIYYETLNEKSVIDNKLF